MRYLSICALVALAACQADLDRAAEPTPVTYPTTERVAQSDDYFGTTVADPYRWLEDDNSEATKDWVNRQNAVTESYLSQLPAREAIRQRMESLWNYERVSAPFKRGDFYYFFKNDGLQNQALLYRSSTLNGEAELVLDPNQLSADGTASLGGYSFSQDGRYLAHQISEGGSDWRTVRVLDTQTGQNTEDLLEWVKFSGLSWAGDGFYYSRYPAPESGDELSAANENQALYYHRIGEPQSQDRLVHNDSANPRFGFSGSTTEDERFLVMSTWESTSGNRLAFRDLSRPNAKLTTVVDEFADDYRLIDSDGERLFVLTNNEADKWRLVAIDARRPQRENWTTILPESDDVLSGVQLLNGKLVATYLEDAKSAVRVFDLDGKAIGQIDLPGVGTVGGFSGKRDAVDAFYSFSSFAQPSTIYRVNLDTYQSELYRRPEIDFDVDNYETKQLFYQGKDGTDISLFVTHRKGLALDGQRPTLLYGYGGFDISILPQFNVTRLNLGPVILENGGILAVANIRGGGEYGKAWHQQGTLQQKQNVFDDFQRAAEYLIEQKYTSSDKLSIYGRSNGGLLVGACLTQRPDLYAVALPAVGVLDMLRYHEFTIGAAWAGDYGRSDESKEMFDYLRAYSPVHNTPPEEYPATLITTADHDDRVVPAHSFKFAAALQAAQRGDDPALIRIETSAGHGAGKPTSKKIAEATDLLSFTLYHLDETYAPVRPIAD